MKKFVSNPCEDCSIPPNHMLTDITTKESQNQRFSIKCRDCGDYWEQDHLDPE